MHRLERWVLFCFQLVEVWYWKYGYKKDSQEGAREGAGRWSDRSRIVPGRSARAGADRSGCGLRWGGPVHVDPAGRFRASREARRKVCGSGVSEGGHPAGRSPKRVKDRGGAVSGRAAMRDRVPVSSSSVMRLEANPDLSRSLSLLKLAEAFLVRVLGPRRSGVCQDKKRLGGRWGRAGRVNLSSFGGQRCGLLVGDCEAWRRARWPEKERGFVALIWAVVSGGRTISRRGIDKVNT